METSWDLSDEDYTEEKFDEFLIKTRENLARLEINKQNIPENDQEKDNQDENDKAFMEFLTQLRNSSIQAEKSNISKTASPCRIQKSRNSSLIEDSTKVATPNKNPDMTEFEKQFLDSREECSQNLYKYFNDKIFDKKLPSDMKVVWTTTLRTTAGLTHCKIKNGVDYLCYIELASKVCTTFERLRDTLLHEMCHAAVFMISKNQQDNHGPLWKTWAARCNMILPDIIIPERCHNYEISYPFYYKCNKCTWKLGRYKRSAKIARRPCPKCQASLTLIKGENL